MSATNKKLQKKAALAAEGLTQKQQREQQEAQAAKRKKNAYIAVGTVCGICAAALLIWNGWSGFSERLHNNDVAATVDGVDYTVGDLQYYYFSARQQVYSMWYTYSYYGIDIGFDPSVDDGAQWQSEENNKTYADYFRESALATLKATAALCAEAEEAGYTISEEGQATIDQNLIQIDAYRAQSGLSRNDYLKQVFGNAVTEKVYVRNLTNDIIASEYTEQHEEGIEVTEADIENYYTENKDTLDSYDYRYFFINGTAADPVDENGDALTDEEGNTITATDEEKAAALAEAKEKADAAVAEINAAEDKEAAFIEAAPKYVSESTSGAYAADESYSLQSGIMGSTLANSSSSYASWLKEADRVKGDVTAIETTSGYFVVMYLDRYRDDDPTVNVRHLLVMTDTSDSTETDDNGYAIPTQEARDAAKAKAEEYLAEWKAGEATEETFAAMAEKYSEDGRDDDNNLNAAGGLYESIYKGEMVDSFNDWIFDKSRQVGDVGIVENVGRYSGWHIIYFSGVDEEPQWRTTAESSAKDAMQDEWYDEVTDSLEVVEASGMKYVGSANTAVATATATPAESEPVESESAE